MTTHKLASKLSKSIAEKASSLTPKERQSRHERLLKLAKGGK